MELPGIIICSILIIGFIAFIISCIYDYIKLTKEDELKEQKNNIKKNKIEKVNVETLDIEVKKHFNKLSVIGFLFTITTPFFSFLSSFGIVGLILGIVGLNEINRLKERGKGLAIAAIIVGFIWGILNPIIKSFI